MLYVRDKYYRNHPGMLLPDGDKLSIFGGKGEEGETKADTLKRELREEIGIVPETLKYLGVLPPVTTHVRHISVGELTDEQFGKIEKGDEGQFWGLYDLDWILNHKEALAKDVPKIFDENNRTALEKIAKGDFRYVQPEDLGLIKNPER